MVSEPFTWIVAVTAVPLAGAFSPPPPPQPTSPAPMPSAKPKRSPRADVSLLIPRPPFTQSHAAATDRQDEIADLGLQERIGFLVRRAYLGLGPGDEAWILD